MPGVTSGSGLAAVLQDGFRVRYLGSMGFTGPRRAVSAGMRALQRPLLELYSAARRRGEDRRSAHPLSLTQFLDVSDYGLVVVDIEEEEDGDLAPVITKVITPVSNLLLWAAVRFHTRTNRKRSFGAAFVPVACSDGVLDKDSFIQLGVKQRFLASLSHPPLFVCLLQRVDAPKSLECHAFVCASAEDSLTICSVVSGAKDGGRTVGSLGYFSQHGSTTYRSTDVSHSEEDVVSTVTPASSTLTEESSRVSRRSRLQSPKNRRSVSYPRPAEYSPVLGRRYMTPQEDIDEDTSRTPRLSKRFIQNGYNEPPPIRVRTPSPETYRDAPQYEKVGFTNGEDRQRGAQTDSTDTRRAKSLPRYQFGQNEKSFQAGAEKSGSSLNSSSEATSSTKPKETITVIHTVDFSSENESVHNVVANGAREKKKRYKSVACSTRSDIVPAQKKNVRKDSSTMTDSSTPWPSTEHSSDQEESDPSHKRYVKGPRRTETGYPHRKRVESAEVAKSLDFESESDISQVISDRKYKRAQQKVDKTVWLHPVENITNGHSHQISEDESFTRAEYIDTRQGSRYEPRYFSKSASYEDIVGNGTSRVTISVPYHKSPGSDSSSYTPSRASYIPHGVKGFHRRGQVRNWSTLSMASDQSYQGSATLPLTKSSRQQKVIRWSSVEGLPRRRGLLTSIKRFSVRSLTRAKKKTEQLLNSLKRRMKDKPVQMYHNQPHPHRRLGSETDSAYDTSEVCLSPDGTMQRQGTRQHRRESWSFHDLREEFPPEAPARRLKNNRTVSPGQGSGASSGPREHVMTRSNKKRTKNHRNRPRTSNDSSDSGLEESDYSDKLNRARVPQSEMEHFASEVSLVSVNGHRPKDYHRYSQTNLHSELGYMP